MAPYAPPAISPILREAVELKFSDFKRAKEAFKNRYFGADSVLDNNDTTLARSIALLEQIKKFDPYLEDDDDLETLSRLIEQAKTDPSISQGQIHKYELRLLDKLALESNRQDVSSFHNDLLKEVLDADQSASAATAKLEKVALEDDFDMIEDELESTFENFERNAFRAREINVEGLEAHLATLFDDDVTKDALKRLRDDIEEFGNDLMNGSDEDLGDEQLEWVINDLLEHGLLSDEKKQKLSEYLQSPVAIRELRKTLSCKSIRHWTWRDAAKGLPVTARQNSEGKYCITVEEDVLDMLFFHTLAMAWSMKVKDLLEDFISDGRIWKRSAAITPNEVDKRDYYLASPKPPPRKVPPPKATICTVCHGPPPPPGPQMMPPPPPFVGGPPPPPPVWSSRPKKIKKGAPRAILWGFSLHEERHRNYVNEFFLSRLHKRCGSVAEAPTSQETQANLLKYLAVEFKLRAALDGEAHTFSTNFTSFASSLPHQTILTVLKFVGVPELWLDFFTRFLEAPLNMGPIVRGTNDQVVKRACGIPVAHGFESFFGELIMFFLDFSVHKNSGGNLFRLRDHAYFIGSEEQCTNAKTAMAEFSNPTGLNLVIDNSLGTIGFLNFKTASFPICIIDNQKVDAEARRIKKQLATCTTVIDWIRTWNSTAGTYAPHLFGPLANIFGTEHLKAVTDAYKRMHALIFEDSAYGRNLTDCVKSLIYTRLAFSNFKTPYDLEPLIYMPIAYGGLGVQNPFITLNIARDMQDKPDEAITRFLDEEKAFYKKFAEGWAALKKVDRDNKLASFFGPDNERIQAAFGDANMSEFMSFDEFTRFREALPYPSIPLPPYPTPVPAYTSPPSVIGLYNALLDEPKDYIDTSMRVSDGVRACAGRNGMKYWRNLSGEDRWVLQMYGDDCFERFGSLEVWSADAVPLEVLRMVRGEEVDVEDDDSSISDLTEV